MNNSRITFEGTNPIKSTSAMSTVIRFNRDSRRIESVVVCETTVEESEFVWVRPAEEAAQWIARFKEEDREWFGR